MLPDFNEFLTLGESRAAAVRAGIEALRALDRRRVTDLAVVEGYRRTPPSELERDAALASLRDAILEEPWRAILIEARCGGQSLKRWAAGRSW